MTKTKRQQSSSLEAFAKHFASPAHWNERWESSLHAAMVQPTRYSTLYNLYSPKDDFVQAVGSVAHLTKVNFPIGKGTINDDELQCFIRQPGPDANPEENNQSFPHPATSSNDLFTHWNLDTASLLAVHVLHIQPGDKVLDLCASPGGKSIAMAQSIWPHLHPSSTLPPLMTAKKGCLHSNEVDRTRHKRLHDNLAAYLPSICVQPGLAKSLCLDGTQGAQNFPLGLGGYDKVLLDAPCSSERHILHAQDRAAHSSPSRVADELARWSPSTSKRLAETQAKLLHTALRAVRLGGRVVYATCSISKEENDEVVEKVILQIQNAQRKGLLRWTAETETLSTDTIDALSTWAERTRTGWIVLPDHTTPYGAGWGPLFFAAITKVASP